MLHLRRTGLVLVLLAATVGSVGLWRTTSTSVTDFTSYWIAGHQLLKRANPYEAHRALEVERSMGFAERKPLVMRNPPWALWITLPLGTLGYANARLLWTASLVIMLWFAAERLWIVYGGDRRHRWIAIVLTFIFAPTLACLSAGQTAPIVLLGLSLFLLLHTRHEFWAGLALLLAAFKPQVAFLFWLILLVWSLQHRKWKTLAGVLSGIVLATATALLFDPHAMGDYRTMLLSESIELQFIPTLGGFLRKLFGSAWMQLLPAAVGFVWAWVYYFWRQHDWQWSRCLPALLFLSLLLTPYAWLGDEVVVLIGLIGAARAIALSGRNLGIALTYVAVNIAVVVLLVSGVRVNSPYYIWTIWVWIIFYFVVKRNSGEGQHSRLRIPDEVIAKKP